jgi:ABC-2 type transport system ATP-binding protein
MDAVVARGLVKEYGRLRALAGVDIEVRRGEAFGLLGPNGAGKTTFVKCLLDLIRPTDGSIEIFGRAPSDTESRRKVGFAPELPQFSGFLSGDEVMRTHGRLAGLASDEIERQRGVLLDEAGLSDAPRRVRAYSKGMVRRLAVAVSLIGQPDLLVLDEPTADLDPIGRREIRNKLIALKERGTTILLNSHLLSEVERVCDRVAIVHRGRVLAAGTVAELVPEGKDLEDVFVDLVERSG